MPVEIVNLGGGRMRRRRQPYRARQFGLGEQLLAGFANNVGEGFSAGREREFMKDMALLQAEISSDARGEEQTNLLSQLKAMSDADLERMERMFIQQGIESGRVRESEAEARRAERNFAKGESKAERESAETRFETEASIRRQEEENRIEILRGQLGITTKQMEAILESNKRLGRTQDLGSFRELIGGTLEDKATRAGEKAQLRGQADQGRYVDESRRYARLIQRGAESTERLFRASDTIRSDFMEASKKNDDGTLVDPVRARAAGEAADELDLLFSEQQPGLGSKILGGMTKFALPAFGQLMDARSRAFSGARDQLGEIADTLAPPLADPMMAGLQAQSAERESQGPMRARLRREQLNLLPDDLRKAAAAAMGIMDEGRINPETTTPFIAPTLPPRAARTRVIPSDEEDDELLRMLGIR